MSHNVINDSEQTLENVEDNMESPSLENQNRSRENERVNVRRRLEDLLEAKRLSKDLDEYQEYVPEHDFYYQELVTEPSLDQKE